LLSVVVPAEGRSEAIAALVTSLQQAWLVHARVSSTQHAAAEVVEFLIVDSTEPPLDPAAIGAWDVSWMYVRRGTRNVRQKRNQGAAEARGEWIAFIDSDCVVMPEYLQAVLAAVERQETRAFAGRVEFRGAENAVWRVIAESRLVTPQTQTAGEGETAWCATANLIVERRLFEALRGFDESLPFRLGGDDVDFGLRLQRSGNALRILPDAVVVHPKEAWSQWSAILPRAWRWGRVEYHLGLRHPDKLRKTPPFFTGAGLTFALACGAGAAWTGRSALFWLLPLWVVLSTLFSTLFTGGRGAAPFGFRYVGGWLERVYHFGALWEHFRAGSVRFLWEGLILEDTMENLFPNEPLQNWANLLAALLAGLVGAAIVTR
jgi:glycosyltransferase involved in cell wall biosynthesis